VDHPRDPGAGGRPPLSPTASRLVSAAETLRRWLRPPRTLRPTRAGWCFFAITFGVGFAALNTGNNLLYLVLSLMLAFLVLSGALSESALRGISVRRCLPGELFAGASVSVGLALSNSQRRIPAFALVVEDCVAREGGGTRSVGRAFALRVGPGQSELRSYRLVAERRGELRFAAFHVYTRFPFGLFSKSLTLEAPQTALVYPQVEEVEALLHLGRARERGEGRAGARGGGALVAGLRDWEPGDALRRIHWPSSLRRGALAVREPEREECSEVEVRLQTAGRRPGVAFERSVCRAASEVVAFLDAGARVALRTDAECIAADSGAHQRGALLSLLARVEPLDAEAA
jgi:uncharacterized protein (DUF58 family)